MMAIRKMQPEDFEPLVDLWQARWADAHAAITPPALTALRSRDDFTRRLARFGDDVQVIGPIGAPQGFIAVKGNRLDQIYVARALAGTGAAAGLLASAEAQIAAAGHRQAQLECAIGNDRAVRFYEKSGWVLRGIETYPMDTPAGPWPYELMIFVKDLA